MFLCETWFTYASIGREVVAFQREVPASFWYTMEKIDLEGKEDVRVFR